MKQLAVMLSLFAMSSVAIAKSPRQTTITLSLENATLKEVFRSIEDQGYFRFVYKDEVLPDDHRVTINVENATLEQVLRKILYRTQLEYKKISEKLIVITRGGQKMFVAPDPVNVSGKVTNNKGEPLSGVSIFEKATQNGVTSKEDGSFQIAVSKPDATLVLTYVGFQSQEVSVNNRTDVTIVMVADSTNLNDVVVIGYQSVRRKDLTGATGVVDMAQANRLTTASAGEAIQGLVPGVTVRNGGNPGSNASVEIRGVSNFGNSSPLYVIDGMLADANTTVNTDDIATIQVLKDASAAAIYGSRAGNGVIIITTKKGKSGDPVVNLSAKYGLQQIPKQWDVMSAPQYLQTVKTAYANSGVNLPAEVAAQLANPTVNTDWQDEVFRTGNSQDYNASISGGSKGGTYLVSGSYYNNKGVVISNDFERASLRVNTEIKKGRVTVGENMMLSNSVGHNPGGNINAFFESASSLPTIGVKGDQYNTIPSNPAGWGFGSNENPSYASNYVAVSALDKINYNYAKLIGNGYLDIRVTNWLSYRFNVGLETSFDHNREIRDTGIWRYGNQPPLTSINEGRQQFTNFLMEHTLNFNKSFGASSINGVIGFSRTEQRRDTVGGGRTVLQTVNGQQFVTIGSAIGDASTDGGVRLFWRNHGYLGRINYNFDDRYLVTLTGRIDQDSRFGSNFRTGYFPSVAAAWRVTREKFFTVNWVNDLKIRASYGKLGFSDVLGSWDRIATLNNNPRAVYGAGQVPIVGQYQAGLSNPDLRWETRIQKNVGFDASVLNNRLSISADYYNTMSKDVLVQLPIAIYLGANNAPSVNAASIRNSGVELSATYRGAPRKFHWDVSANFTTIRNRVESVGNQGLDAAGNNVNYLEPTNFLRAQVGHAIGEWYVIQTAGIFQSQDEVNNYTSKSGTVIQPNAKPGDIKYIDANGDGAINNGDRQFSGSPWPTLQAGGQFNAYYGQFNLNVQLVGVFGNTLYDYTRLVLDGYQLTNFRTGIDPWSPDHTSGKDPRLAVQQPSDPAASDNNMPQTNRWLESGSYVRIRNLEIGYNFKKPFLERASITGGRLYLSGQNLFTFTKYKGLDPDVQGNGIVERGYDLGNWPASRILSVGLQCEF